MPAELLGALKMKRRSLNFWEVEGKPLLRFSRGKDPRRMRLETKLLVM